MQSHTEYIIAAYIVGAICVKGYALWLFFARAKIKKQIMDNTSAKEQRA